MTPTVSKLSLAPRCLAKCGSVSLVLKQSADQFEQRKMLGTAIAPHEELANVELGYIPA
jgi:hypothetical protein